MPIQPKSPEDIVKEFIDSFYAKEENDQVAKKGIGRPWAKMVGLEPWLKSALASYALYLEGKMHKVCDSCGDETDSQWKLLRHEAEELMKDV